MFSPKSSAPAAAAPRRQRRPSSAPAGVVFAALGAERVEAGRRSWAGGDVSDGGRKGKQGNQQRCGGACHFWMQSVCDRRPMTWLLMRAHFHWPAGLGSSAGDLHFFTQFRGSAVNRSQAIAIGHQFRSPPVCPICDGANVARAPAPALRLRLCLRPAPAPAPAASAIIDRLTAAAPLLRPRRRRGLLAPRPGLGCVVARAACVVARAACVVGRSEDLRTICDGLLSAPAAKPLARPAQSTPRQGAADAGAEGDD